METGVLSRASFWLDTLNKRRLKLSASLSATKVKGRGLLSADSTLLTHHGEHSGHIAHPRNPLNR